jgi:hypothetical protein
MTKSRQASPKLCPPLTGAEKAALWVSQVRLEDIMRADEHTRKLLLGHFMRVKELINQAEQAERSAGRVAIETKAGLASKAAQ